VGKQAQLCKAHRQQTHGGRGGSDGPKDMALIPFRLASMWGKLRDVDGWVRNRLRYCIWKDWKKPERNTEEPDPLES